MSYFNPKSYCYETIAKTGELVEADFTLEQAKERIKTYDINYLKNVLAERIIGTFTMQDAINSELRFHQLKVKNAQDLGFGNSEAFGTHCINVLKEIKQSLSNGDVEINNQNETIEVGAFLPKAFPEIFDRPELVNDCIALLKETDPPCIDDKNEYLKSKGTFVVWFNALEAKKMLNCHFSNDIQRADTLNKNFQGLNISGPTFRAQNKKAHTFKSFFETQMASLKQQH